MVVVDVVLVVVVDIGAIVVVDNSNVGAIICWLSDKVDGSGVTASTNSLAVGVSAAALALLSTVAT